MSFPKKMIEWRQLDSSQSWHLFFGNKSICSRVTSNGYFNFSEAKPPKGEKICQLCSTESMAFLSRVQSII